MKRNITFVIISILLIVIISFAFNVVRSENKESTINLADPFFVPKNSSTQDIEKLATGTTISNLEAQVKDLEDNNKLQET